MSEDFIINVLMPVVMALVGFLIERVLRSRKELAWGLLSVFNLIKLNENPDVLAGKLLIAFDGVPINNAKLFILEFKNTGNQSIKRDDFDRPLEVMFHEQAKILNCDIIKRHPNDFGVEFELISDCMIRFSPALMNSNDYFKVKVLIDSEHEDLNIAARVVGISTLALLRHQSRSFIFDYIVYILCIGIFIGMEFYLLNQSSFTQNVYILSFVLGISLFAVAKLVILLRKRVSSRYFDERY